MASRRTVREDAPDAEAAGAKYAEDQINSDHFMNWVGDQLVEASKMDPSEVLPMETKTDAKVIARNMLQQLEWDTRRELQGDEIERLIGAERVTRDNITEFYKGFRSALDSSRDWLADELLEMKGESGRSVEAARRRPGGRVREIHGYNIEVFFKDEHLARKFERQIEDALRLPLVSQGALRDGYRLEYGPIEGGDYLKLERAIYGKVGNAGRVRLVQVMYGGASENRRPKARGGRCGAVADRPRDRPCGLVHHRPRRRRLSS